MIFSNNSIIKKRIVIVEDDLLIQELHKQYIEKMGHEVVAAFSSGEDAIDFFRKHNADLILMDIRLESALDGIETMKKIHSFTDIPVLYVTGNTEEGNLRKALNNHMKGFLAKPVMPEDLEDLIDSVNTINDSIRYAEKIQKALFPQKGEMRRIFNKCVYINRPKDTITGDFPFLLFKQKHLQIFGGIGDCTGHGIPAALLSVLCHEIVNNQTRKYSDLRLIINRINRKVMESLARKEGDTSLRDGLDLILFKVEPEEAVIEIAGVKRPFIHFDSKSGKHNYYSIRGKSIGEVFDPEYDIPVFRIPYSENDFFYFFSDGITDQFGGINGKKLMKRRLLEFLDASKDMPSEMLEIELELFLRKWQGTHMQTDDILLIGLNPAQLSFGNHLKTLTKN